MGAFHNTALRPFWFKSDLLNCSNSMLHTYHALYQIVPSSIVFFKKINQNNKDPATALAVYTKPDSIFSPTTCVPQSREFHLEGATTLPHRDFCSGKNLFWGTCSVTVLFSLWSTLSSSSLKNTLSSMAHHPRHSYGMKKQMADLYMRHFSSIKSKKGEPFATGSHSLCTSGNPHVPTQASSQQSSSSFPADSPLTLTLWQWLFTPSSNQNTPFQISLRLHLCQGLSPPFT